MVFIVVMGIAHEDKQATIIKNKNGLRNEKIKIKKFLLNEFQKNKNLKSKTIPPT